MIHPSSKTALLFSVGAILVLGGLAAAPSAFAQNRVHPLDETVDRLAQSVEDSVISWRREIHQHPELGNREFRTAEMVASHLRGLGMEVRTEIAHTGVVGVLRGGGGPGPVVALRADMDALPVKEMVDLPFASKVVTSYGGVEVGVMHACGHDAHTAILLGAASVLSEMRARLPGIIMFIFQPAEEGAPAGEDGGAKLMLQQGVFDNPSPDVIFGLHVVSAGEVGQIFYRSGPALASSDEIRIAVRGRQTHGAYPWSGVDPIVAASQIVLALQTIPSRQIDVTRAPAVISIGSISGGIRHNIIPEEVLMTGIIRTFDDSMRTDVHRRVKRTAEHVAAAAGAKAEVEISIGYPETYNDPGLTQMMLPTLERVVGAENVSEARLGMAADDFSYFQREVPGLYFQLGLRTPGVDPTLFAPNHSPHFRVDESTLIQGVRALVYLATDYTRLGQN